MVVTVPGEVLLGSRMFRYVDSHPHPGTQLLSVMGAWGLGLGALCSAFPVDQQEDRVSSFCPQGAGPRGKSPCNVSSCLLEGHRRGFH